MDGVEAYKYTGVITGREMEEVMRSSGALDSMGSSLGLSGSDLGSMVAGLDMTDIMDALVRNIVESAGGAEAGMTMSIPKMTIVLTCSHINSATEFTIPDEARSAS